MAKKITGVATQRYRRPKPQGTQIIITMSPDAYAMLKQIAIVEKRSLKWQLEVIVEEVMPEQYAIYAAQEDAAQPQEA